ncbi:MAG: NAD(P)/FAD-dependent oxidoreductase [Ilumatobacter sp.]|jgi:predicted Rossmann fold flavoprotein|uniref:NAD(P)/FAD-dependent oxidoreductase n=1 Tax=Ilumatobacter sp. TaxID=1967498 RepID=UPI001D208390|nr:NAD(P)/FAD-dependent oxidoreductase [Ilumatobacter sp.]MBT5277007.1 NAD(P)/FAD-dependent oxidoreductase [Ilumatobacter sp.]MBT5552297.1 NAD(P)/FAD-dependent oxidoreductase [Ilumatobacter sp.]MBT5866161.1 NAD(P)/FAD-dependent oxidoreductase [Ilumatobacter sp.]MDG0975610.1 NAD(P)/FAD-dependent oxidoreductase [Ilumatobacter sp.]
MFVDLIVVGGGAAGFFAAITCAESSGKSVLILEKTSHLLQKVKISGGGRCNVTHDCLDPRELSRSYPRGEKSLIGPFHRFGAADTVEWFAGRGVALKTEADGRMFPETDSSQTIVDALLGAAEAAGVSIRTSEGVTSVVKNEDNFDLVTDVGNSYTAANVLISTGGTRLAAGAQLATSLGHELKPPTPSLFTFKIKDPRIDGLAGLAVSPAEVSIQQSKLSSSGPVLITHWGLSGPGILRISAWGARELAARDYRFDISVNWLPDLDPAAVVAEKRLGEAKRQLSSRSPFAALPKRLWLRLLAAAEVSETATWSQLSKTQATRLVSQLTASTFTVSGKSMNKDEFVTCGGVALNEIDFRTMESKLVHGLYFAGEVIDVDGITGGFNFQNAWTNGFHAGLDIAAR